GVSVDALLLQLLSGQPPLRRVDHDDEIAAVLVRREVVLIFAPQDRSDLRGQPAEDLPLGVDQPPAAALFRRGDGGHESVLASVCRVSDRAALYGLRYGASRNCTGSVHPVHFIPFLEWYC